MVTKFAQKSQKLILDDITFLSIYGGWIGISEQKWMNSFFKTICINKLEFNNNNTKKSPKNTKNITNSFKVDKNYVCKYCLFYFSTKEACKNHEKFIHESDDYLFKCQECQKGFKTKFGLKTHHKNKHERTQTKFICEVCGKVFTNRINLKRHCSVNGHKCSGISHKINWKSTPCKLCNKIVVDIDAHNLAYHSNVFHKKHQCKDCDFQTNRIDSLYRHRRLLHGVHNRDLRAIDKTFENSNNVEFQCENCKKVLKSEAEIEHHIVNKCNDIICDVCGKQYRLKQHLVRHKKKNKH